MSFDLISQWAWDLTKVHIYNLSVNFLAFISSFLLFKHTYLCDLVRQVL